MYCQYVYISVHFEDGFCCDYTSPSHSITLIKFQVQVVIDYAPSITVSIPLECTLFHMYQYNNIIHVHNSGPVLWTTHMFIACAYFMLP